MLLVIMGSIFLMWNLIILGRFLHATCMPPGPPRSSHRKTQHTMTKPYLTPIENKRERSITKVSFFSVSLSYIAHSYQNKTSLSNLTFRQWKLSEEMLYNDEHIVIECDKNLGGACLDRSVHNTRGVTEHLGNTEVYKRLTKNKLMTWLTTYATRSLSLLPNGKSTSLQRSGPTYTRPLLNILLSWPDFEWP